MTIHIDTMLRGLAVTAIALLSGAASPLNAQVMGARVGEPAPAFSLYDSEGVQQRLEAYRGSYVVLEWTNLRCEDVEVRYEAGYLQELQTRYTDRGVVWLSMISSAKGRQGNEPRDRMNKMLEKRGARQTAILFDHDGTVGTIYGARTTPQAFVIDPEGTVVYAGALDDQPRATAEMLDAATNYVARALDDAMEGRPVDIPVTEPFGCDVRYARRRAAGG